MRALVGTGGIVVDFRQPGYSEKELEPMASPVGNSVQTPLNLILPIKSWLQLEELHTVLRLTEKKSAGAADSIGTLHFARFFDLHDNNQMGFFTTYDGTFEDYMHDFLKDIGDIFEILNKHVVEPAPSPIEKHLEEWIKWATQRNIEGIGFYSAYPNLSVQDIRSRAGITSGAVNSGKQSPLTLVLPTKSPEHLMAASQLITQALPKFYAAANAIGTVHSARFVPMGSSALTLIAEYDGTLGQLCDDVSKQIGPLFDGIFTNVTDPPPTPVQKNAGAFGDWVARHNLKSWVFYTGYPTLSVKDILAQAAKAA